VEVLAGREIHFEVIGSGDRRSKVAPIREFVTPISFDVAFGYKNRSERDLSNPVRKLLLGRIPHYEIYRHVFAFRSRKAPEKSES
jgi:hypothetical protein